MKKLIPIIVLILLVVMPRLGFTLYYFPNKAVTDQGSTSGRSVKNMVDAIGASKNATITLKHSSNSNTTPYLFETNEVTTSNIFIEVEPGAYIDGNATLTIYSPENIIASSKQQIFGNPNIVSFTVPGKVYAEWWGAIVNDSTSDAEEIQAAYEASNLELLEGTYNVDNSSFSDANGIVCSSAGIYCNVDNRKIIGQGYLKTTIELDANSDGSILFIDDASDIQISGINFDGNGSNQSATSWHMVVIGDSNCINIDHCRFYDAAKDGIYIYGCEDVWINDNLFVDNYRDGITNGYASSNKLYLTDNIFRDHDHWVANGDDHNSISIDLIVYDSIISRNQIYNTWCGIAIETSQDYTGLVESNNNIISGNLIKNSVVDPGVYGIEIRGKLNNAFNNVVSDNIIEGEFSQMLAALGDPNGTYSPKGSVFNGNIVKSSDYYNTIGLYLSYADGCSFTNNMVSDLWTYGAYLDHSNKCIINQNRIVDCALDANYSRGAINVQYSSFNNINNNMIDGNSHHYGINLTQGSDFNNIYQNHILPGTNINSSDDKYSISGTAGYGNVIDGYYYITPGGISTDPNEGAIEQTLKSWYIPQDAHLYIEGIKIFAAGNKSGTAGTKRIRFHLGTATIDIIDPNTNNESSWRFESNVYFQGYNSQRFSYWCLDGETQDDPNGTYWSGIEHAYYTSSSDLTSGDTLIKITGWPSDPNDTITAILFEVQNIPIAKE